jgi:hypothetical protein
MSINRGGQQPTPIRPTMRAAPNQETQGPSARLRRIVSRIMRGDRLRPRLALLALHIEYLLTGPRDAAASSYTETVIRALGKAAGDRILQKVWRILDALARKADGLRARQATLNIHADYRDGDIIEHPDGGVQTVSKTAADQDGLRSQVNEDIAVGSYRHRRLPAGLRRVPLVVFAADGGLLLYFFSGITNVDWQGNPLSVALAFAVLLAVMVTGLSFAFFRFTGDRLQQYKDDTGTVPLLGLDTVTKASMGLAAGAMMVLATLMFLRMHAEVLTTLGQGADVTAIVVGLTLAVVGILANTLVIAVHALDGSAETDRLDALGKAVAPAMDAQHHLREEAAALGPAIAVTIREAERAADAGITEAGYERAAADRITDAGRAATQATGPVSGPATDPNDENGVIGYRRADVNPEVDERSIHHTVDQIRTPLPRDDQVAA